MAEFLIFFKDHWSKSVELTPEQEIKIDIEPIECDPKNLPKMKLKYIGIIEPFIKGL